MITTEHAVIRAAEPDDAPVLQAVYRAGAPRACLLDQRREPVLPTYDEITEVMAQKEIGYPVFYAVEDKTGGLRGFCSLRGLNPEVNYSEWIVMLLEDADLKTPLAADMADFLKRQAFQRLGLNKVITHALECETALRDFLLRHGFRSDGIQREAVFTAGRYYDIETLSLFRAATPYAARPSPCAGRAEAAEEAPWP